MNRKYTVGIIEDEIIERRALRLIIDRNRPILQVAFEAGDGNSALDLVHKHIPDILVVDIQIPERSGLDLCSDLRREGYAGIIIISTSYSLFHYAYQAIKLEVFDYLLKPTEEAQILEALDRCVVRLEEDKKAREKQETLMSNISQTRQDADFWFIDQMLSGNVRLLPRLDEIGFPEENHWQTFWISVLLRDSEGKERGGSESVSLYTSVYRIFEDLFFVFSRIEQKQILLLVQPKKFYELSQLYSILRCYIWDLKQMTGQDAACYVSPLCESIADAKTFGRDIPDLSALQFTCRDFVAYTFFDRLSRSFTKDSYTFHIHRILRLLQDHKIRYLENEILSEMKKYGKEDSGKAWEYMRIVMDAFLSFSDKWDLTMLQQNIDRQELIWDMQKLREILEQVLKTNQRSVSEDQQDSIDRIFQIMRTEYASDLSQSEIASRVGMTQTYFSRMFKNKTGKNFVSVLTEIRMERAKELIQENSKITIEELTRACGYTSGTYFCFLFRKTMGVTVSEYQRKVKHEK